MANSGPNTNGSQFFINYAKQPHLNGFYTVFGKVIHGFEVLDLMEKVCDLSVGTPINMPSYLKPKEVDTHDNAKYNLPVFQVF